ncbi:MAG TPA: ATP-binding protein [Nannocystis sp.]
MPSKQHDFETRARIGYGIVTVLLAVGMALSVHRLSTTARDQVVRLRAEEHALTLVERLRWSSELVVSGGRGYLFSGDPDLLARVEAATERFDQRLDELLAIHAGDPEGRAHVRDAARDVREFMHLQRELLAARARAEDPRELVRRFETELLPLRDRFQRALTRLVEHHEQSLARSYDFARTQRTRLELRFYGLLALLVLASLGIALYFTRQLGRAYAQERAARETAHKALAARDDLMAVVAHDLRNPLNAITMKAAILRRQAPTDAVRERAAAIENVAGRMEHLIKNMLDVTTMEAGKFAVDPAPCAADDIVRESISMFAPLAASRRIQLESRIDTPGLTLLADRERVLQVLSNLLGNALKFTPPGGRVVLALEQRGLDACFAVRDTGPGIAPEHLPRLFERFWQDNTTGKKGTGLGLFIARSIVDAHGGKIWAHSDPDTGASFFFTLPLALPVPTRAGERDRSAPGR